MQRRFIVGLLGALVLGAALAVGAMVLAGRQASAANPSFSLVGATATQSVTQTWTPLGSSTPASTLTRTPTITNTATHIPGCTPTSTGVARYTPRPCETAPYSATSSCVAPGLYGYSFNFYNQCYVDTTVTGVLYFEVATSPGGPFSAYDQVSFQVLLPGGSDSWLAGSFTEGSIPAPFSWYHVRMYAHAGYWDISYETPPNQICYPLSQTPTRTFTLTGTPPTRTRTPTITITPTPTFTVTPTFTPTYGPCAQPVEEGFESGGLGVFDSMGNPGWGAVDAVRRTGQYSAYAPDVGYISDQRLALSKPIAIPLNATSATLTFWHRRDFEVQPNYPNIAYDGGLLETSTDGGATWIDPQITSGGYNASIGGPCNVRNPLYGRAAWGGSSGGAFVRTTADLALYRGQSILFRFRLGTDETGAAGGWWIDDLAVNITQSFCFSPTATTTPTGTLPTFTNTPTGTSTSTPTITTTPPNTFTPIYTPTPTNTGTPPTLTPTLTRTLTPTVTITRTSTITPSPTQTACVNYAYTTSTEASILPGVFDAGNHCDNCVAVILLPFTYSYYGQTYNNVLASSNGFLQFGGTSSNPDNACLPGSNPSNAISVHWDDLRTDGNSACAGGCGIYFSTSGSAPNRIVNIEWRAVYNNNTSQQANFEARLYEGQQRFDFVYGAVQQGGSDATVGAQRDNGSLYIQYECNTPGTLSQGLRIAFAWRYCGPGTPTDTPEISPTYTSTPTVTHTYTPTNTATYPPSPTPRCLGGRYSDVCPNDYFYTSVIYLSEHGVVSGYADGTFRPFNNTTRGQMCKIIVLAEGWTVDCPAENHFSDVLHDDTFYCFIETAYAYGIVAGYSDGTFRPGSNVTRGQLCKIVVLSENWQLECPLTPHFSDVPSTDPFYCYIETAYAHSIITGYADGTFRPGNPATRGQICKIVFQAVTQH